MNDRAYIRVSPFSISHKLSCDLHETEAADWVGKIYAPLDETIKHRSIYQHYADGLPWEETELFTQIYPRRFAEGQVVRGCSTIEQLATQYYERMDGMFRNMRERGFEELEYIPVVIGPTGNLVIGNDGNHRLAMAKVLNLGSVVVRVRGELEKVTCEHTPVPLVPALHDGAREIPAMTTVEERTAYYKLALEMAGKGAIVELGTWLGAATVFLAAALRDSGAPGEVHTYDRFVWRKIHEYKAGGPLNGTMLDQFIANMGPLAIRVKTHVGEIMASRWGLGAIGLLVADGPKRVREITKVLQIFGTSVMPGGYMAWQDFAYFPAYDIPACLHRLEEAGKIEFVSSVYPGTTVVFRVLSSIWDDGFVESKFALYKWSPSLIIETWEKWNERLEPEMRPRWMCGAALFLSDRGAKNEAVNLFRKLLKDQPGDIVSKWVYLREKKAGFEAQYQHLYKVLNEH